MIFPSLYKRIEEISSRSGVLILFLLAHAVLLIMLLYTFPSINERMEGKAFDLRTFGYSFEEAHFLIGNLDSQTTDFYIFPQLLLLDVLYPLLLALFLSSLIIRLFKLIGVPADSGYTNLYLLPFGAMMFDYLENATIVHMIVDPGSLSSQIVTLASSFTLLKSSLTLLSWILILILCVRWLLLRFRKKPQHVQ